MTKPAYIICFQSGEGYSPVDENGNIDGTITFFQKEELKQSIEDIGDKMEVCPEDFVVFEIKEIIDHEDI